MAMLVSMAISIIFCAVLSCCLVSPAQALVTDKTTAQGNNATKDVILGGVSTRITWEGTVDDDETLASLSFTFPSGTSVSDETSVDCVALDGLDRITTPYTYTIDDEGMTVIFDDPVEAGSLVRVMIYKITPRRRIWSFKWASVIPPVPVRYTR